jgi:hypothetical protein
LAMKGRRSDWKLRVARLREGFVEGTTTLGARITSVSSLIVIRFL